MGCSKYDQETGLGQTETWLFEEKGVCCRRAALHEKYNAWAKSLACQLFATYKVRGISVADYVQYAQIGLLEAIDRYQACRAVPFKPYAIRRIRGAILNGVVKYSEEAHSTDWQNKRVKERLLSFQIDPKKLARQDLVETVLNLAIGFILDDNELEKPTEVQDYADLNCHEMAVMASRIKQMINCLPKREREVVRAHYIENKTFSEIAKKLDVSVGRVSQNHARALQTMRKKLDW